MEEEEAAAQEDRQTDGLMSSVSPTSCLWLLLMPVGRHDHQMIGDHMSSSGGQGPAGNQDNNHHFIVGL